MYLQDTNIIKKEEMKCKFKMSHLEEIICLKLAILMMFMDVKICLKERLSHMCSSAAKRAAGGGRRGGAFIAPPTTSRYSSLWPDNPAARGPDNPPLLQSGDLFRY